MTPCIEWTRARSSTGYGVVRVEGKTRAVHRLTWEQHHGRIPAGMYVARTHCLRGHPLKGSNLLRGAQRRCRTCHYERVRLYKLKRRANACNSGGEVWSGNVRDSDGATLAAA